MNSTLMDHATDTITVGSKSFATAAKLFDPATRRSVLMLYAWCRYCDDVIDGQELGFNTAARPDAARAAFYDDLFALYKQAQAGLAPVSHGLARLTQPRAVAQSAPALTAAR